MSLFSLFSLALTFFAGPPSTDGSILPDGVKPNLTTPVEPTAPEWEGYSQIKYAFTFGDSWSQTGFNHNGTPPSPGNPLGNPPYPGLSTASGPNWVDFLTVKYNQSLVLTHNLAYAAATVDKALVAPVHPETRAFKNQVLDVFIPYYTGTEPKAPSPPAWQGNDTLFVIWIGNNDVNKTFKDEYGFMDLYRACLKEYLELIRKLYEAGARNFVFILIPPLYRAPVFIKMGPDVQQKLAAALEYWNGLFRLMATEFRTNATEANVWVYDPMPDFHIALNTPTAYSQTANITVNAEFCEAYKLGTPELDTYDESCKAPMNQYFWVDHLHPSHPVHSMIASRIVTLLDGRPNVS